MSRIVPFANDYERVKFFEGVIFVCFLISITASGFSFLQIKLSNDLTDIVKCTFFLSTCAIFILGLFVRISWLPQAEEPRIKDFYSRAFDAGSTPAQTEGYYNDTETTHHKKLASQVLENLFFTKVISQKYYDQILPRVILYFAVWFVMLAWRGTTLDTLTFVTQLFLSEEILSKALRVRWLKTRSSQLYDDMFCLISHSPRVNVLLSNTLEVNTVYERIKAAASVNLPTKIFDKLNSDLSVQWTDIQKTLGIQP